MKIKMIFRIAFVIVGVAVLFFIHSYNNKFQNTLNEREIFISQRELGAIINSETIVNEHIISEITAGNKYGYAVFEPCGKNKYCWQSMSLTQSQIWAETILINDSSYEILICQKPNLDYVRTVYTDTDSGEIISSETTGLNGKTLVVQKSPNFKSYTRNVTWYDTSGNQYTK